MHHRFGGAAGARLSVDQRHPPVRSEEVRRGSFTIDATEPHETAFPSVLHLRSDRSANIGNPLCRRNTASPIPVSGTSDIGGSRHASRRARGVAARVAARGVKALFAYSGKGAPR